MRSLVLLFMVFLSGCTTIGYSNSTEGISIPTQSEYVSVTDSTFIPAEVDTSIEMCVDLDSEDDWNFDDRGVSSIFAPRISTTWTKIYDSRDTFDPTLNGFGPFQNAWTLWKGAEGAYIIAIRGTVMSSKPSVVEDAIITTVPAHAGIQYPKNRYPLITFDRIDSGSEVHAGFAYATFILLFDSEKGILKTIKEKVPSGTTLIITGHSQGAAMGTLVHSFMYWSMRDNQWGLVENQYKLKSYLFAQPKPGNDKYANSFKIIAQNNSWVFNNTLDVVPRVPLTRENIVDADLNLPDTRSTLRKIVEGTNSILDRSHMEMSKMVSGDLSSRISNQSFYMDSELIHDSLSSTLPSYSQYFMPAGNLIPLMGMYSGKYYPAQRVDDFIQHHATSYRYLLNERFNR